MNDISNINTDGLPSTKSLIKATFAALIVGTAILVTTILPAEYGVDPTGLGKTLGLDVLHQAQVAEPELPELNNATELATLEVINPLIQAVSVPRSDTMKITLMPKQGAEIKSPMNTGDSFVFTWSAEGGSVYFDMHGEELNAGKDEFTSYWIGKNQQQASGNFTAPFKGTHGWYWQNTSDAPVTITLKTHGFYSELYMP